MKRLIWLITIIFITISCTKEEKSTNEEFNVKAFETKSDSLSYLENEIDFIAFKLRTPKGWKKIESQGIDSYVGGILTNNNDTVRFDLGRYSNSFSDELVVYLDTIDGYNVKIVKPYKIGKGVVGMYIDSLWTSGYDKGSFNLYGVNLCEQDQKDLLNVIGTIKFDEQYIVEQIENEKYRHGK